MAKTRVNIRIDEKLWARVRAFAATHGRTVTSVVEEALVGEFGGIPVAPSSEERLEGQPGYTSEGQPAVMQGGVTGALKTVYVEDCPYTAIQLRGKSNGALTLSAAERAIKDGTWRKWL